MVKRTRKEQNVEPSAEKMHYEAKKRRLAYRSSVTCGKKLFGNSGPPSIKKAREAANKEFRPQYDSERLKELGEKGRRLFLDD